MDESTARDFIEDLMQQRDHYRRVAEEAVANLEQAVRLLETMQKAMHE